MMQSVVTGNVRQIVLPLMPRDDVHEGDLGVDETVARDWGNVTRFFCEEIPIFVKEIWKVYELITVLG